MSVQAYFSEVEAVCEVLAGLAAKFEPRDFEPGDQADRPVVTEEDFTALWQAAELLARAHAYISAQINAEMAMQALNLPDVQVDQPKQPKAARLYDAQGRPLA